MVGKEIPLEISMEVESFPTGYCRSLKSHLTQPKYFFWGLLPLLWYKVIGSLITFFVGFFMGVILTALYPLYSSLMINALLRGKELIQEKAFYVNSIFYSLIALCVIASSLVTFDITKSIYMSNLKVKNYKV